MANGVTQSASFEARLCLVNKTTHDGDRHEVITRRSLVQITPKQPTMRTDLDIGAENPETKRFLVFFFLFFKVEFYRYPPSKTSFGEDLNYGN